MIADLIMVLTPNNIIKLSLTIMSDQFSLIKLVWTDVVIAIVRENREKEKFLEIK